MSIEEKMDMLRRKIKDGALGADDARRALRAEIDGELRKAPADVDMDAVNACEALLAELSGAKEETHAAQNLRAIREKLHPQKRAPKRSAAVAALLAAAMALALRYALVPKGALLTVAKCTGGLIMLLVVIRPLLALGLNGLQVGYEEWERTIQQQTDDYTAANQQEMEVIIQQETVAYISEKAAELGLTCSPEVTCQLQDCVPFPVELSMDIPKYASRSRFIAADLGIDEAHQRWRETE